MLYNNIWKVSWKKEEIDYKTLMNDVKDNIHNGLILQKINNNDLINNIYPDINDTVFISCENKRIIRCIIIAVNIIGKFEDKYTLIKEEKLINYNLLKIQQIYLDETFMKTSKKIWEEN